MCTYEKSDQREGGSGGGGGGLNKPLIYFLAQGPPPTLHITEKIGANSFSFSDCPFLVSIDWTNNVSFVYT